MIESLLEYKKDFLESLVRTRSQQRLLLENLSAEVKSICSLSTSKVQSYYVVEDTNILYFPCETFSKFPALKKLLVFVNEQFECSLNACAVSYTHLTLPTKRIV